MGNLYSVISKRLGWKRPPDVVIPGVEKAKELRAKAEAGDAAAFEEIFRIHRFAESPETEEEAKAIEEIHEAFVKVSLKFREVEAEDGDWD